MTKPNKDKEQHFLIDEHILNLEIKIANLDNKDKIVEIGAGDGKLTKELVKKANYVLAFETDSRFKEKLDKIQQQNKNIKFIYKSALNYSWRGYNKIVSNIPYSLSGAIIEKAITEEIQELTLIVGEKFKSNLESKEKIGIIANLFFDIEFIKKVDKSCFYPIPRVNSWLIKLTRKEKSKQSKSNLILMDLINSDRTIKNAIIYSFVKNNLTKNKARDFIEKNKFEEIAINKSVKNLTGKFLKKIQQGLAFLNQTI
jgi:16S rRNA (adenine1518-N6/adenine1519-N6)-dimethyltransferase